MYENEQLSSAPSSPPLSQRGMTNGGQQNSMTSEMSQTSPKTLSPANGALTRVRFQILYCFQSVRSSISTHSYMTYPSSSSFAINGQSSSWISRPFNALLSLAYHSTGHPSCSLTVSSKTFPSSPCQTVHQSSIFFFFSFDVMDIVTILLLLPLLFVRFHNSRALVQVIFQALGKPCHFSFSIDNLASPTFLFLYFRRLGFSLFPHIFWSHLFINTPSF